MNSPARDHCVIHLLSFLHSFFTDLNGHLVYQHCRWLLHSIRCCCLSLQDDQAKAYFGQTSEEHQASSGYYAMSSVFFSSCSDLFKPQVLYGHRTELTAGLKEATRNCATGYGERGQAGAAYIAWISWTVCTTLFLGSAILTDMQRQEKNLWHFAWHMGWLLYRCSLVIIVWGWKLRVGGNQLFMRFEGGWVRRELLAWI